MNRGYVRLWRKIEDSAVFKNEGLLKVFIWCLLRANHKEAFVQVKTGRGLSEVKLLPGSFLFGRESAAKRLDMSPSTVWKRILKLKTLEFLNIESNSHYSIIHIIHWPVYQAVPENSNSESDRQVTGKEHRQEFKNYKNKKTSTSLSEISSLEEKYSDGDLINRGFEAISSTRKTKRISDSVKLSILQQWDKYPADHVMAGIRIYLEKDYAGQGKKENYLLGIIRGNTQQKPVTNILGCMVMKSTGSIALDNAYRQQGYQIL